MLFRSCSISSFSAVMLLLLFKFGQAAKPICRLIVLLALTLYHASIRKSKGKNNINRFSIQFLRFIFAIPSMYSQPPLQRPLDYALRSARYILGRFPRVFFEPAFLDFRPYGDAIPQSVSVPRRKPSPGIRNQTCPCYRRFSQDLPALLIFQPAAIFTVFSGFPAFAPAISATL